MRLTLLLLAALSISEAVGAKHDAILITSTELAEAWKPFAEWKTEHGKATKVITTDEITKQFEGADIQDKIRKCVRQHIDEHETRWVILGGDSQPGGKGIVPDRDTVHKTQWGRNTDIPTDIYYLSPTDWDADGDGVFGEFEDDRKAITYPDGKVGLGRIPVRTAADIKAYTDKVISYESRYPEGEFSNHMIYTCTVPGAFAKVRRSWDEHVSKALPDGTMSRHFSGDHDLTTTNWLEMINEKKIGKFHFHGHGLINGWMLDEHKMFTKKHVAKLTNKDAYPIITTVSCFTGHYDAKQDPCISEAMLRKAEAGAIAIVAPCREGKPHFLDPKNDFRLMVREGKMDGTTTTMTLFWELGIRDQLTTGEALIATKVSLIEKAQKSATFHMCVCELNLLGDPTLAVHPVQTTTSND